MRRVQEEHNGTLKLSGKIGFGTHFDMQRCSER